MEEEEDLYKKRLEQQIQQVHLAHQRDVEAFDAAMASNQPFVSTIPNSCSMDRFCLVKEKKL